MAEHVVFDTNVWVSGLLWRGKPYQCLLLARTRVVQVLSCTPMGAELSRKLREKFLFNENRIHAVMYELRTIAEEVEITGNLHVVPDDPTDDMFVECAVVGGASVIVSHDHHLLDLGSYGDISILSPTTFLKQFS